MISNACKYAIRAVVFVAARAGEKHTIKQIAAAIDAPEAFTAKTLQVLNKHRIITSLKGPYGGFFIEPYQSEQAVIHIVHAVDGLSVFSECGLGLKQCSAKHPCPMHDQYKAVREALRTTFEQTTIGALAANVAGGRFFLNNGKELTVERSTEEIH